jgi:ATP-binding protein involved in chromosome partitioning
MDIGDPFGFAGGSYDPTGEGEASPPPIAGSVVVVASGKGGVGKSTISLNVALALAETGASVGLLDADVYAPDIPLMLNLTRREQRKRWPMYRNPRFGELSLEPVERFGLKVMSAGFLIGEDQSLSLPGSSIYFVLNQLARQVAWGPLNYLLVDLPPGTADVQQHIVRLLRPSGALIVVGPQDVAHLDAKKVLSMFREAGVPVLGGVENMHALVCPHCQGEVEIFPTVRESRAIWSGGVKRIAELPFEPRLAHIAEQGRPLLVAEPGSAQAGRFRHIAASVAAGLRDE